MPSHFYHRQLRYWDIHCLAVSRFVLNVNLTDISDKVNLILLIHPSNNLTLEQFLNNAINKRTNRWHLSFDLPRHIIYCFNKEYFLSKLSVSLNKLYSF